MTPKPLSDQSARYVADNTASGEPCVLDVMLDPASVVCVCGSDARATWVALALNERDETVHALGDLLGRLHRLPDEQRARVLNSDASDEERRGG